MVCLKFGLGRWEGNSGGCFSSSASSRSLCCLYFLKPVCVLKNPRRAPIRERDVTGAEEAHVYVRTVPGNEEPVRDTSRPAAEMERRRGLWWLIPRLSLE